MVSFNEWKPGISADKLVLNIESFMELRGFDRLRMIFEDHNFRKWCQYVVLMWHEESPLLKEVSTDLMKRSDTAMVTCGFTGLGNGHKWMESEEDMRRHRDPNMVVMVREFMKWHNNTVLTAIISIDFVIWEASELIITKIKPGNNPSDELKAIQEKIKVAGTLRQLDTDRKALLRQLFGAMDNTIVTIDDKEMNVLATPVLAEIAESRDSLDVEVSKPYSSQFVEASELRSLRTNVVRPREHKK